MRPTQDPCGAAYTWAVIGTSACTAAPPDPILVYTWLKYLPAGEAWRALLVKGRARRAKSNAPMRFVKRNDRGAPLDTDVGCRRCAACVVWAGLPNWLGTMKGFGS